MAININPLLGEEELLKNFAEESAKYRGVPARLIHRVKEDHIYDEGEVQQELSWDIYCIFEDNPKHRKLEDLGWLPEDKENIPIILYIPYRMNGVDLEVRRDDLVEFVDSKLQGNEAKKTLEIGDVKMLLQYGYWHICNTHIYEPERMDEPLNNDDPFQNKFVQEGCFVVED